MFSSIRLLLLGAICTALPASVLVAQVPRAMSYQALLTNVSGDPVPDGAYDLTFKLYATADGGTAVWTETLAGVTVTGGVADVVLGSKSPLNIPFDRPYFLGIAIDGGTELTPRSALTSAPYSLSATDGASLWTPTEKGIYFDGGSVGIGTANPGAVLDLGGRGRNIRLGDYGHIGETLSGAATIVANNAKVDSLINNRVVYATTTPDGVSAIELHYLSGISFLTKPYGELNTTGDTFFAFTERDYERMRITGDGEVLIGSTSLSVPNSRLFVSSPFNGIQAETSGNNASAIRAEAESQGGTGVLGFGASNQGYGGRFYGDVGLRAESTAGSLGSDEGNDLILGGNAGRISTITGGLGTADLFLHSADDVFLELDMDNDGEGVFAIQDNAGTNVFEVYDDGRVYADGALAHSSDRTRKHGFEPADPGAILEKVVDLPISRWMFDGQQTTHMGPMAQDFHAAFGLGDDERHIATVDADGVALAAIQGLYLLVQQQRTEIAALREQVEQLSERRP